MRSDGDIQYVMDAGGITGGERKNPGIKKEQIGKRSDEIYAR